MMTPERAKGLIAGFVLGLIISAISWAITVDQIWNSVYDSSNTALRINQVAGS